MEPAPSVAELVERLELEAHPEGGWYRRTWQHEVEVDGRPLASAIDYLLPAGVRSAWHRVDADEMWLFHAGDPLELSMTPDRDVPPEATLLGPASESARLQQATVPAHVWQSARSLGAFTLVICVVVPAFVWEGFELAPEGWTPGADGGEVT
jgi:predicted cupin superfamily sugar epimerase